MDITKIYARQILDSAGTPTVEVDIVAGSDIFARTAVPSGVSTGTHEAVKLPAAKAVANINEVIAKKLIGQPISNQARIDTLMIDLDGTENKSKLGANAILAVSVAVCKAAALFFGKPVYQYIAEISGNPKTELPQPMILMLEGGKHGNWSTDFQEFMIMPTANRFENFSVILEGCLKIFHALKDLLVSKGYSVGVGLEGGFCPKEISSNEEGLQLLVEAVTRAGYEAGKDFGIAIDAAASEFFKNGSYTLPSDNRVYTPYEWTEKIISLTQGYPIFSLEDIHQEDLWEAWVDLREKMGDTHQIVGDDLLATNIKRIQQAIDKKAVNSVIIKLNQIGTITEAIKAVLLTHRAGFKSVVSHRAKETNDDFVADFCIGTGSSQCKFGALNRGERIAKYNQLLRIENQVRESKH